MDLKKTNKSNMKLMTIMCGSCFFWKEKRYDISRLVGNANQLGDECRCERCGSKYYMIYMKKGDYDINYQKVTTTGVWKK